jgi:iron(III) transport system substrate-binding protein
VVSHDGHEGHQGHKIRIFVFLVFFVVCTVFVSSAQDRVAAARKEGTLTLYTTIAEKDLPTLLKPFESKYGIKVTIWRAGTSNVLQRAVQETAAKKYDVDVIHIGSPEMEALAREQILLPITSPVQNDLQAGSVPAHHQWAATLLSVWVQAYNTKLIKKDQLPKTYKDLLDPKWKGKLGIEGKDEDWFASVVDIMGGGETGLKFFRDLMATNGLSVRQGHTLLNNLVISGRGAARAQHLQLHAGAGEEEGRADRLVRARTGDCAFERGRRRQACAAPECGHAVLRLSARRRPAVLRQHGLRAQQHPGAVTAEGIRIVQANPARSLDESDKWTSLFEQVVVRRAKR